MRQHVWKPLLDDHILQIEIVLAYAFLRVGVYNVTSTAFVAYTTMATEKALDVNTRARGGCSEGCTKESQRTDALYYKKCFITQ